MAELPCFRETLDEYPAALRPGLGAFRLLDVADDLAAVRKFLRQPALVKFWLRLKRLPHFLGKDGFARGGVGCECEINRVTRLDPGGPQQLDFKGQPVVSALAGQERDAVDVFIEVKQGVHRAAGAEFLHCGLGHVDPADQREAVEFGAQFDHRDETGRPDPR